MKHTIERVDADNYILNDKYDIRYIQQLGNDNGWCVFDENTFYQKVYRTMEDAMLVAIEESIRKPDVLTPPVGV